MRNRLWVWLPTVILVTGLFLASGASITQAATQTQTPTQGTISYTVRKGDCLSILAVRYHVKVADIKRANGLKSDLIRIGQVLKIPVTGNTTAAQKTTSAAASPAVTATAARPAADQALPEATGQEQSASRSGTTDRAALIATARRFLNTPYRYGGQSPKTGFDCSGFTRYVFKLHDLELPRSSSAQAQMGTAVDRSELQPGDLVFFNTDKPGNINHVGIYLGNNSFIHASRTLGITITSLDDKWYKPKYAGARRVN